MCMYECVHKCVLVCVCVREREREREGQRQRDGMLMNAGNGSISDK